MEIIKINPHAEERAKQRGAAFNEIEQTVLFGEQFPAKHGRFGFRRNFYLPVNGMEVFMSLNNWKFMP